MFGSDAMTMMTEDGYRGLARVVHSPHPPSLLQNSYRDRLLALEEYLVLVSQAEVVLVGNASQTQDRRTA